MSHSDEIKLFARCPRCGALMNFETPTTRHYVCGAEGSFETGVYTTMCDRPQGDTMPTQEETWVCRDGRRIKVGDMTEDHAKNALRMLIRSLRKEQQGKTEPVEDWEARFWNETFPYGPNQ